MSFEVERQVHRAISSIRDHELPAPHLEVLGPPSCTTHYMIYMYTVPPTPQRHIKLCIQKIDFLGQGLRLSVQGYRPMKAR